MKLPHLSFSYGRELKPARDWGGLLAIAALCLIASLGWNLWLFDRVSSGEVLGSKPASIPSAFDQSELDKLAKIFSSRADEVTKYEKGVYHFIDPSK